MSWAACDHRRIDYSLTQALTGHGYYKKYVQNGLVNFQTINAYTAVVLSRQYSRVSVGAGNGGNL